MQFLCNCYVVTVGCSIEVMSYTCCADQIGFVNINGDRVWEGAYPGTKVGVPNNRGVNIIPIDPFTCTAQESSTFDTWAWDTAASELKSYLRQLNNGAVIVGVSGDDPTTHLANALPALEELGVEVGDVKHRGTFAFLVQKGHPENTVQHKVLTAAESIARPAQFDTVISGTQNYVNSSSNCYESCTSKILKNRRVCCNKIFAW